MRRYIRSASWSIPNWQLQKPSLEELAALERPAVQSLLSFNVECMEVENIFALTQQARAEVEAAGKARTCKTESGMVDEIYAQWFVCSLCGCDDILKRHNFCPNCGSKIDNSDTTP